MADPSLNTPVIIQATRLDASILPRNVFSQSYLLYVIAQGTDVGAIAGKANEAGQGAYDAQVKNDEQDVIRKAIYTTNAIESLNSVIRAAIKKRKVFPTDDSVRKVIYLAIKDASKKWSMPIQNWRLAMSRFIIEFGDRLSDHL